MLSDYVDSLKINAADSDFYKTMLRFLGKWASGELQTGAHYLWKLALEHPSYQQDSMLTQDMIYDIVNHAQHIGCTEWPEDLLGQKPLFVDDLSWESCL